MELKPGSRWKSTVCDTEVVLVRPPSAAASLECGGQPMVAHSAERPAGLSLSPDRAEGSLLGKRYVDAETGLEALCSKPGAGSLSLDGRPLTMKEAKKLPASD
ncbi:MAG: hypothetical protein ACXWKO_00895 [Phenylobacterium sp.]